MKYSAIRPYLGSVEQVFSVRRSRIDGGRGDGVRVIDVSNGGDLSVTILPDRCMDIHSVRFRGKNLSYLAPNGISHPAYYNPFGEGWSESYYGGFLYTCGLSNVGGGCEEDGFYHYVHGHLKNTPAQNICHETLWDGDDCDIRIAGDVRDAAFFGRNLLMHREIRARVGEKRLFIEDTIENQGFAHEQLMLLYHMNLGFPILDEDTMLIAPVIREEPLSDHTIANDPDYARMIAPIDNNIEYLHALTLRSDANGRTICAVYNEKLGLGFYVRYNTDLMRYLIQWKCMSSGDYALGVLPSSCKPVGRAADRASGEARTIAPGEILRASIEAGVIDGPAEMDAIRREIEAMK